MANRRRKLDFSETENAALIAAVADKYRILQQSEKTASINRKKTKAWEAIREAVNAVGSQNREKKAIIKRWRVMRDLVRSKPVRAKATGGGPSEQAIPFEDSILAIIQGSKTLDGCVHEDDGDSYTGTSVSVMNNSLPLSDAAMSRQLIYHEEEGDITDNEDNDLDETVVYNYEVPTPVENVLIVPPNFSASEPSEPGANSNGTSTQETRDVSTVSQHTSKAKVSRRAKGSQQGDDPLWEDYLKAVNRKHVADTKLSEIQYKKVRLEIAVLKHELKGKNFTDSEIDAILSGKD